MEVRVSNVISDQASDGSNEWSKFFCMNVEESVVPFLERLLRHVPGCQGACKYRLRVDKLQFRYKEDFWVDDFFITNREFAGKTRQSMLTCMHTLGNSNFNFNLQ